MPVFHFTFHAFGTWLPDRPEGYVRRDRGWQPPSSVATELYRSNMKQAEVSFNDEQQRLLLQALIDCQAYQRVRLYAIAIDATHVHVVVAWNDERRPGPVRSQMKYSMTRRLIRAHGKRKWFGKNGGQTPVCDEEHLCRLVDLYLSKHTVYWKPSSNGSTEG